MELLTREDVRRMSDNGTRGPVVVNKAMACEVTYEYFFGDSRRVGVFGGLGFSLGDFEATDPVIGWDFQIGVAVKLWTK